MLHPRHRRLAVPVAATVMAVVLGVAAFALAADSPPPGHPFAVCENPTTDGTVPIAVTDGTVPIAVTDQTLPGGRVDLCPSPTTSIPVDTTTAVSEVLIHDPIRFGLDLAEVDWDAELWWAWR